MTQCQAGVEWQEAGTGGWETLELEEQNTDVRKIHSLRKTKKYAGINYLVYGVGANVPGSHLS